MDPYFLYLVRKSPRLRLRDYRCKWQCLTSTDKRTRSREEGGQDRWWYVETSRRLVIRLSSCRGCISSVYHVHVHGYSRHRRFALNNSSSSNFSKRSDRTIILSPRNFFPTTAPKIQRETIDVDLSDKYKRRIQKKIVIRKFFVYIHAACIEYQIERKIIIRVFFFFFHPKAHIVRNGGGESSSCYFGWRRAWTTSALSYDLITNVVTLLWLAAIRVGAARSTTVGRESGIMYHRCSDWRGDL